MWRDETTADPLFSDTLALDLSSVEPSLAGPRRPQDRVLLSKAATAFLGELKSFGVEAGRAAKIRAGCWQRLHHHTWRGRAGRDHQLHQHL